jgi:shikimate dehydrogenase
MTIFGRTKVLGIIGDPISHSLSPVMQNVALAAGQLDYVYVPFAVKSDELGQAVAGLRSLGVCGFNVTIPHKSAVIPFLDCLDESAESAGAVNTVLLKEGRLIGYNTDGDGLVRSLSVDLDYIPEGKRILVAGAGGAARGAIAALCRNKALTIGIYNRSTENARNMQADMMNRYPETTIEVLGSSVDVQSWLPSASLLLNTTSLGMKGESIPGINVQLLPRGAKIYDMVYTKSLTPLLQEAVSLGLSGANGLGMLVAQGERAFEIWIGQKPQDGVMRGSLAGL